MHTDEHGCLENIREGLRRLQNTSLRLLCLLICVHLCASVAHSQTATLAAIGDVLLDRGVAKQIRAHGTNYPFQHAAPLLRGADITFGNLECPLATRGQKVLKPFSFKADPAFAPCLNDAGFDIISLSNNHTLDCGRIGLQETMATLQSRQIRWCGAGNNRTLAEAPTILTVRGLRVAFVGFCEFVPEGVFLNDEKPSIALADDERVRYTIQNARRQADVVIVSYHGGIEYQNRPSARQKQFARLVAKAGADLVLGHHPHVLQGVEILSGAKGRRCVVAYSLGNFLFDAPGRFVKATEDTAIFRCTLDKSGVRSAWFTPMKIEKARPRPARPDEAKLALSRLSKWCAELGTKMKQGKLILP